jgi:hypothetical protein
MEEGFNMIVEHTRQSKTQQKREREAIGRNREKRP